MAEHIDELTKMLEGGICAACKNNGNFITSNNNNIVVKRAHT